MPTYEFKCLKCNKKFEEFLSIDSVFNVSMNQNVRIKCQFCGHTKVELLISGGTGFILNGSGFYANDYKNKGKVNE